MRKSCAAQRKLAWAFVIVSCASAQEIHLKTRTISTTPAASSTALHASGQRPDARQTVHQIVEFDHPPGVGDLERAASGRRTGYRYASGQRRRHLHTWRSQFSTIRRDLDWPARSH